MRLREFAPGGGGADGNYFRELASAWYNGTFDSGSLQKGIKSQQDVERLLQRGVIAKDGKMRKYHIDYNGDFDGVEIFSDDYYEYGDHDDTIDSRTGQKWGPYDFMAFSDEQLDESLNELAPPSGNNGDDEMAILKYYAGLWWNSNDATRQYVEKTLAKMGWEIGEDEGGYDNGGVFVVQPGDENGRSYESWPAEELTEGLTEVDRRGFLKGMGAAAVAGTAVGANAFDFGKKNNEKKFEDFITEPADKEKYLGLHKKAKQLYTAMAINPSLRAAAYVEIAAFKTFKKQMAEKYNISDNLDEQGVAEGSEDPFGPQGRFVGDTGPAQITTTVARVQLKPGDKVLYKPTEQRARIEAMSRDGTQARIHIPSPMGGKTFNCKTSDLKALGALKEKSTSQAQFRTMAAAAHDPKFARKVGIKQSVAKEFNKADKGQSYKSLPKRAD